MGGRWMTARRRALETTGFVVRSPHPTDRRATVVSLTHQGTALSTGWHRDRDDGTADLLGDTSPADLGTFVTVLDRILGNLRTGREGD